MQKAQSLSWCWHGQCNGVSCWHDGVRSKKTQNILYGWVSPEHPQLHVIRMETIFMDCFHHARAKLLNYSWHSQWIEYPVGMTESGPEGLEHLVRLSIQEDPQFHVMLLIERVSMACLYARAKLLHCSWPRQWVLAVGMISLVDPDLSMAKQTWIHPKVLCLW